MTKEQFIEEIFELAFGDNAINRDFSFEEVLTKLKEDSDKVAEMESDESPQLEALADEIKLELHDKNMMYIDGEDNVTHRWCKQIIWRVLSKRLNPIVESEVSHV